MIPPAYAAKIREVYPGLALDDLQLVSDGMVNDVVVVNHELVCRFVRNVENAEDAATLAREAAVLRVVHDWVDLPTPQFEHLEAGFASYRFIPGEPLSRNELARLSPPGRARIIAELSRFHSQLHGIPAEVLTASDLPRSASVRSRADWLDLHDRVRNSLFPHLWTHQRVWVDELFAPVVSGQLDLTYAPTLIHGDLASYHLFHDPEREALTGVIDFGVAGLGDPACDIAVQLGNYGDGLVQRMATHHPRLLDVIDRARFWAGTFELQWATAGLEHDDVSLLLAHIGGNRDVGPVGC